jgi:hypothetical protein
MWCSPKTYLSTGLGGAIPPLQSCVGNWWDNLSEGAGYPIPFDPKGISWIASSLNLE